MKTIPKGWFRECAEKRVPLERVLYEAAGEYVRTVLERHDWNRSEAARAMGVCRNTVASLCREHGIQKPPQPGNGRHHEAHVGIFGQGKP